MAKGLYVARMDADDISYPNRLGEQIRFLEKNPHVSVLGTYASLFNDDGLIWGKYYQPIKPILNDWLKGPRVIHASVIMRKIIIDDMGGYDANALRIEDFDLWLRMLAKGYVIRTLPMELYGIHWNFNDYSRKTNKSRMLAFKYSMIRFNNLDVPFYKYFVYSLKHILLIFVPNFILWIFHLFSKKQLFNNSNYGSIYEKIKTSSE